MEESNKHEVGGESDKFARLLPPRDFTLSNLIKEKILFTNRSVGGLEVVTQALVCLLCSFTTLSKIRQHLKVRTNIEDNPNEAPCFQTSRMISQLLQKSPGATWWYNTSRTYRESIMRPFLFRRAQISPNNQRLGKLQHSNQRSFPKTWLNFVIFLDLSILRCNVFNSFARSTLRTGRLSSCNSQPIRRHPASSESFLHVASHPQRPDF